MDSLTLTIALVTVALGTVAVVGTMALYRRQKPLYLFALGFVSAAAGVALFTGQGQFSPWICLVLANALLLAFLLCLVCGVRMISGVLRPLPWRFILYFVLWLSIQWYAVFMHPDVRLRVVAYSVFNLLMGGEFLWAFSRCRESAESAVKRSVLAHGGVFILMHGARLVAVLMQAESPLPLIEDALGFQLFLLGNIFLIISWAGTVVGIDAATLFRELSEKNRVLGELATTDPLTGLHNRHLLDQKVLAETERARRYEQPLSLIMFDLDHFKQVNDCWGHDAGDQVLRMAASVASDMIREPDNIFRWGGEEFIILTPHTGLAGAVILAEKLRNALAEVDHPVVGPVSASFGVTEWRVGEAQEAWFKRVDRALYRAKNGGRNRVVSLAALDHPPLSMVRLEWQIDWDSGNRTIDEEHRLLVEMSNQLLDLSQTGAAVSELASQLDRLLEHVVHHFADEEAVLRQVAFPGLASHHDIHQRLIVDAQLLKTRFLHGELTPVELFNFLVGQVIIGHLQAVDTEFFPWTRAPVSGIDRDPAPGCR